MKFFFVIMAMVSVRSAFGSGCDRSNHTTVDWEAVSVESMGDEVLRLSGEPNIECGWDYSTIRFAGDSRIFKTKARCEKVRKWFHKSSPNWLRVERANVTFSGLDECNDRNGEQVRSGQYRVQITVFDSSPPDPSPRQILLLSPIDPFQGVAPLFPCTIGRNRIEFDGDIDLLQKLSTSPTCTSQPVRECELVEMPHDEDGYFSEHTIYGIKFNGRFIFTVRTPHWELTYGSALGTSNAGLIAMNKMSQLIRTNMCRQL